MDYNTFKMQSVESLKMNIAERVRARRLEKNFTQRSFAKRAGIGYDAYRAFESTGDTSFHNLLLIAVVLGEEDIFMTMFTQKKYQSIDDVIRQKEEKTRKRASR